MTTDLVIELEHPARMSRAHLLIRLLIAVVTGALANAVGWPGAIVYLAVPAIAAILISQHGVERYLTEDAPILMRLLGWLMGFNAYMLLLTDHFPLGTPGDPVRYEGGCHGAPTVASAALRVFTTIPAIIVVALIGIASWLVWLLSVIAVLVVAHYPRSWFDFQCAVLRFQGRIFAYHASVVDEYPPIALVLGPSRPGSHEVHAGVS